MNVFIAVCVMTCSVFTTEIGKRKDIKECIPDSKINVRKADIVETEEFSYVQCLHTDYSGSFINCRESIWNGCKLTLTGDRVYFSSYSCDRYTR